MSTNLFAFYFAVGCLARNLQRRLRNAHQLALAFVQPSLGPNSIHRVVRGRGARQCDANARAVRYSQSLYSPRHILGNVFQSAGLALIIALIVLAVQGMAGAPRTVGENTQRFWETDIPRVSKTSKLGSACSVGVSVSFDGSAPAYVRILNPSQPAWHGRVSLSRGLMAYSSLPGRPLAPSFLPESIGRIQLASISVSIAGWTLSAVSRPLQPLIYTSRAVYFPSHVSHPGARAVRENCWVWLLPSLAAK